MSEDLLKEIRALERTQLIAEIERLRRILARLAYAFENGNGDGLFTSEDIDALEEAREATKDADSTQ